MRIFAPIVCLLPIAGFADTFAVSAPIRDVTVYPERATVKRIGAVEVPAGSHEVIVSDLPVNISPEDVRVVLGGAQLAAQSIRTRFVPPIDLETPELDAAEALIDGIEDRISAVQDEAAAARNASAAANAQLEFLEQLGSSEGLADVDAERLRAMSRMIGEEALAARQKALTATIEARDIADRLDDLREELERAEAARDALVPEAEDRAHLVMTIDAPQASVVTMEISYRAVASWTPVYDVRLERGQTDTVTFRRGALVEQYSDENWDNVNMVLSTVQILSQLAPDTPRPLARRIVDPVQPKLQRGFGSSDSELVAAAPAPAVLEAVASADYGGFAVVYNVPLQVTVASRADALRIALDELEFPAEVTAEAVAYQDDTAFLIGSFTNTSSEPLLPSDYMSLFVGDAWVGDGYMKMLPAGAEEELGFGRLHGLQIVRDVLDQNEGDRGLISRSNTQSEAVEIRVRNVTDEVWDLRLLDRVPYSTQEDLEIEWNADPVPDDENVDNARGILGWDMTLQPGENRTIRLDHTLTWPDGKVLR